jgi:hypothetical protein
LDSAEIIVISVARTGLLIKLQKSMGVITELFSAVLYRDRVITTVVGLSVILTLEYPTRAPLLPTFKNPVLAACANAVWHCATAAEVVAVLMQASRRAATEDITQLAGMLAASEAAKNWKPRSPRYKSCTVIYSDGHTAEKPLVPEEIATWPVESNNLFEKEARSYRIIRIVDDSDVTVWSDGKQELTVHFDGGEVARITLPPDEIERWAYKTQITGRLIEAICDDEGYVIWPEKDGSRIL